MNFITEHKKLIDVFPDKVGKIAQRLHQKKEDIPYVKKYYVADKQEKEKKERAVISYISTSIRDRDGDILLPEGVELTNYRKNPVVFYGHDYRGVPIGKNAWIKSDEKGLRAKTFFAKNQKADELYHAYTDDIEDLGPLLAGWSVGFIPLEWEDIEVKDKSNDKPGKKYTKWELLEYSAVGIPSCPEALTVAEEKGLIPKSVKKDIEYMIERDKPEEEKELEVVKDAIVETEWVIEKDEQKKDVEWTDEQINKALKKGEIEEVITKPETIDQYHRIPVNPGCEVTATITISASQGIKAIYCGKVKKVHTYLFDVNKWTMEEAKKWVEDHKDFEIEESQTDELIKEMALETKEEIVEVVDEKDNIHEVTDPIKSDSKEEEIAEKEIADKLKVTIDTSVLEKTIAVVKEQYEKLLEEKDEHIVDLKEGRVLSRKHREIVKSAAVALQEVLKADATGSREDEEQDETEKGIEIIKDGEQITGGEIDERIQKAFIKAIENFDPKKFEEVAEKGMRLAIDKIKGKVR